MTHDNNNGCCGGHDHDHEHDNQHDGCCCGHDHDHDHEEMERIHLVLDDNTELDCFVIGTFQVEDKEYIAMIPEDDDKVLLYEYHETEEGMDLQNIEDEDEFNLVSEAFFALYGDEDYEDEDYEDEEDLEEDN